MKKKEWIIVFLLLFGISQIFAAECGDVNSDGDINIVDALLIAQYYVNLNPDNFDSTLADVNGDGDIDIVDALLVAQYYVGLITDFPGCPEPNFTPSATPCESQAYALQAETEATWDNASVESDHAGYTGSGYVNTDNSAGTWIEWNIDLSTASSAVCMFTYACSSDNRPMDLSVNGNVAANLDFPASGAWTTWAIETGAVILDAGANTIRLTATGGNGAPNIDKMDITINVGCIDMPTLSPVPTADPVIGDGHIIESSFLRLEVEITPYLYRVIEKSTNQVIYV